MPPESPLSPQAPTPQPTPSPAPLPLPTVATSELQRALAEVARTASDPIIKGMTNQLANTLGEAIDPNTPVVKRAFLLEQIENLTDAIRNRLEREQDPQVREHLIKLVGAPTTGETGLLQEFADVVKRIILRAGGPNPPPVRPQAPDDTTRDDDRLASRTDIARVPYDAKPEEIKKIELGKKVAEDVLHLGATLLADKKREQEEWAKRAAAEQDAQHKELIRKIIDHVVALGPKNGGDGGALADIINAVSAPFWGISEGEAVARAEQITARVAREAEERRLLQFPGGQKAAEALHAAAT